MCSLFVRFFFSLFTANASTDSIFAHKENLQACSHHKQQKQQIDTARETKVPTVRIRPPRTREAP